MIRKITILCSVILLTIAGFAQPKTIRVEASNLPLNVVLLQLRNQYDFHFSYSEDQLSRYKITVSRTFVAKDEAVEFLLKDLPFQVKKRTMYSLLFLIRKSSGKNRRKGRHRLQAKL